MIDSLYAAGSERQAAQLAKSLKESSRFQVFVACMRPEGNLGDELKQMGFTDIPAFPITSFYSASMVNQLTRFARFLRERRIDIVHTHDFYTNIFGMTGAWLAGTPARIASRRETTGCRSPVQKFIERRAYHLAHSIVTNAEAVSKHLIEEGVRGDKIVSIYNSLNQERISSQVDRNRTFKMFNLPSNGHCRFVTIVANLTYQVKDHPTFLRAAQLVRQAVPEARFIIVGGGPLMDETRALATELGLKQDVFFTGRCNQVADLLAISDVCVLSSVAEGFSNSILEYMGASRPVVATNVGGAREAIVEGKAGYLVRPGDHETMAARITELLRDPERARSMGEYGRQVIEQKFSPAAQLAQAERLYDRLLGRVRARAYKAVEAMIWLTPLSIVFDQLSAILPWGNR
ncbi:MAG TPA: glycosyltransferase [Blastocatellia bacterium]|nr:glycosyltransferase [Blastocatellia bacterium]